MDRSEPAEFPTRVAIGLISRDGRYLIRRRPPGSIMAGVWEFPGGKLEPGESFEDAVLRECREEIGLDIRVLRRRERVVHRYPHGLIELCFLDCETRSALDEPASGSGFLWVLAQDLPNHQFPGANESVVASLVEESAGRRPKSSRGDRLPGELSVEETA